MGRTKNTGKYSKNSKKSEVNKMKVDKIKGTIIATLKDNLLTIATLAGVLVGK